MKDGSCVDVFAKEKVYIAIYILCTLAFLYFYVFVFLFRNLGCKKFGMKQVVMHHLMILMCASFLTHYKTKIVVCSEVS